MNVSFNKPNKKTDLFTPTDNFSKDFSIHSVIGEGGIGRVYLAYEHAIGRKVAIKELLDVKDQLSADAQQELENSFIHEAKITGKLEHPGIIPIYRLGQRSNYGPYYVMRHVHGQTLEEALRKCQQTNLEEAFRQRMKLLDSLIAACDAVAYAHSKGVIHRDLKPSNIITGQFGETIVLDWGLAQALNEGDDSYFFEQVQSHQHNTYSDISKTASPGTLRYMAPEQIKGKASKESDVYSLGVILFRIITGHFPYKGSNEEIKAKLLSNSPSPSPHQYLTAMSPELGAICEKAMAKNPYDRFANASELSSQLKAYRDGLMVNIYSYSKKELLRRFLAKNKFIVFMIGLLFIAISAGATFSFYYALEMDKAREKAELALVSVTSLGEKAQEQATTIADTINNSLLELRQDMQKAAAQLNNLPSLNLSEEHKILTTLQAQYPKFNSFSIENDTNIPATSGWKLQAKAFIAPIASIENKRLVLTLLVPLKKSNQHIRYLSAKFFPEKVIPNFFPLEVNTTHPKDIWLMQEDGLILYDADIKYQATNLFIDPINIQSPTLVAFGKQTLDKPYGVSYYSFVDQGQKFFKIAAWQTLVFPESKSWKIMVNYTYMNRAAYQSDI